MGQECFQATVEHVDPWGASAWHARFLEWMGVLGFLGETGEETMASKNVALYAAGQPVPQFVGPGAMRAKL